MIDVPPPTPSAPAELPAAATADLPRAWHYGEFYGLRPLPQDKPLLVVHGNCQAESVRVLLGSSPDAACVGIRIPPVHELAADEVPFLERLLRRTAILVVQPIADDYHDLPLGTAQVAAAAHDALTVIFPVFRYQGLFPFQAVFHHATAGDPPVVPYHDLRTLLTASGQRHRLPEPGPEQVQALSEWSIEQLHRREASAGAVPVSDLIEAAGHRAANVINHPGNPVLVGLARRLQEALGWPVDAVDPGRELLDGIHAPLRADVLDALGWGSSGATQDWVVNGKPISDESIVAAHLDWYAARPEVVAEALDRCAEQLQLLGAERVRASG